MYVTAAGVPMTKGKDVLIYAVAYTLAPITA